MRSLIATGLLALSLAALITGLSRPPTVEQQLVHLQVEQSLPHYADALAEEPVELQALFLMYAERPVVVAKTHIALLRYPQLAPPILLQYGEDPVFQDVLARYGEDVLLPIQYFLNHEIFTLDLMRSLSGSARAALDAARGLWSGSSTTETDGRGPLTSEERGRYAIHFIEQEGYDFIGQFVMDAQGQVAWVQTERVLEGINRFFAGGIKGLETKLRRDEPIALGDMGWAAVDVAVGVGAFKLLRMGRAGATGARGVLATPGATGAPALTHSQRLAIVGAGLWRGTFFGTRLVKFGAPAVLAYMALRHPSLINSMLVSAAGHLGLPAWQLQLAGWTLILLPVLWVLRLLSAPLAWFLAGSARMLRRVARGPRYR